ncbi:aldehyde dehydrogenase (NADP(+)) [Phenylobacterium sp. LjRoot225]|uniref:aldehyde dehydrogenase (NADP(+)) n=1 Tax=Phenylobacterium sp. LjRoot225 TaxID=3342285 RepID=UPI003ECE9260
MINGAVLIGSSERRTEATFYAVDPSNGAQLPTAFPEAGAAEAAAACALAAAAFPQFSTLEPEARARFLETVADAILAIGDDLIVSAMTESGLPRPRLESERVRTVNQLRLFAEVVRQGDWLDATIDPALPERTPAPRVDLRRMNVALGPVVVFGASNLPLAFSVAGVDTASAFAAGCPVIVKGHPAHPGTGELVARAIQGAVAACGLPEGVFSFLPGTTNELGHALVADPHVRAVGFTGSRTGGLALMRVAEQRPEPIPVYAEMSSINPVVMLPAALAARAEALGKAFVQSLTLGAGQFCTNPGLVVALSSPDLDRFVVAATAALSETQPAVMLTPGIHASFERGVDALARHPAVVKLAGARVGEGVNQACGAIFQTDAAAFLADPTLSHEVFGSASIVVRCQSAAELEAVIDGLEGQLTATLQFDEADQATAGQLLPALQRKAGRLLANGWPTGVEVTHAMVHGGPFPATSDGRSTSVGSLAMMRFLRPVCYQDLPDPLLPPALQAANPWRLVRRLDGTREQA